MFADRVEFCWIHLRGIGALENSLWAFDGKGLRVWLNALALESPSPQQRANGNSVDVQESVKIPLDFYPLCEYDVYLLNMFNVSTLGQRCLWIKVL